MTQLDEHLGCWITQRDVMLGSEASQAVLGGWGGSRMHAMLKVPPKASGENS